MKTSDRPQAGLRDLWSITAFGDPELSRYAEDSLLGETRTGLEAAALVMLSLVIAGIPICRDLGLGQHYVYGYLAVAAMALHALFSARQVDTLRELHLLGMTLLVICATAFVFVAHGTHAFSTLLFANVVLLFMAIPMLPWGAREVLIVAGLIYGVLALSVGGVADRFGAETMLTLHFLMCGAAAISILLALRGVKIRREDLNARYDLEKARTHLYDLSNRDALTGTWNRRYMPSAFDELVGKYVDTSATFNFVIFDLDEFKQINDRYGHDFGDTALTAVSEALRTAVADNGYVFRLGGDEFVAFYVGNDAEAMLARAHDVLVGNTALRERVNFSSGFASVPLVAGLDLDALYRQADIMLYENKHGPSSAQSTPTTAVV